MRSGAPGTSAPRNPKGAPAARAYMVAAGRNLRALHIIVLERLKEASMRIRKISLTTQISVALGFGLAAAALFWWEVAEPILSSSWSGSTEQWLALACAAIGVCAMLVVFGGVLLAVSKTPQRRD
jgi:hypothetical protein